MSHSALGRLSGYPLCCIVAFKFRWFLMNNSLTRGYMKRRWKRRGPAELKDNAQHVLCWGHILARKLGLYKLTYQTCPTCGWHELNGEPGQCRAELFHTTKREKMIRVNEELKARRREK